MVSKFQFKIEGVDKVEKMLNNKSKEASSKLMEANNEVAKFMESEVVASVEGSRDEKRSVDTSAFLQSIKGRPTDTGAEIYSNIEYAEYLEEGTVKMKARNHFKNSLQRNEDKIQTYYDKKIKEII